MEVVGVAMLAGAFVGAIANGTNEQKNEDDLKKQISQVQAQTQTYKNKIAQMQQKGSYDFQTYLQETIHAGTQITDMHETINLATMKYAEQQRRTFLTGIGIIASVAIVLVIKLYFLQQVTDLWRKIIAGFKKKGEVTASMDKLGGKANTVSK